MTDLQPYLGLGAAPIITALIQVVKPFLTDTRWYPPIAIVLGVVWNVGFVLGTLGDLRLAVLYGVVSGLAASGLYSLAGSVRKEPQSGT